MAIVRLIHFFFNEEEIKSVSCCSITDLKLKEFKINCSKKAYFSVDQINYSSYTSRKDRELIHEFLTSLKTKWTYVSNQRKETTGFYTVYLPSSANCECIELDG